MNKNQLWSIARFILSFGGGVLVTFGYLTNEQLNTIMTSLTEIVGPLTAIGAVVWSMIAHTKANIVAKAADIVPVPATSQAKVGISNPQITPTDPPKPEKAVFPPTRTPGP